MSNSRFIDQNTVAEASWADMRKYLDGTVAALQFFYAAINGDFYRIRTQQFGGLSHQYDLMFSDIADKADFDDNFSISMAPVRRPNEQLDLVEKSSEIFYLGNGDVDKIETTSSGKKQIQQFNYTDDELTSITTTIVDA